MTQNEILAELRKICNEHSLTANEMWIGICDLIKRHRVFLPMPVKFIPTRTYCEIRDYLRTEDYDRNRIEDFMKPIIAERIRRSEKKHPSPVPADKYETSHGVDPDSFMDSVSHDLLMQDGVFNESQDVKKLVEELFNDVDIIDTDKEVEDILYNKLVNEPVDMGLPSGTKWARCNLGAILETEPGYMFAWGATNPVDTDVYYDEKNNKITKYSEVSDYADDVIEQLEPSDDAAYVMTSGEYKIPTSEQIRELLNFTTYEWIENYNDSNVNGLLLTSKRNKNTLFFPAAGFIDNRTKSLTYKNIYVTIWSSTINVEDQAAIAFVINKQWRYNNVRTHNRYGTMSTYSKFIGFASRWNTKRCIRAVLNK